jgi:hypothetical protein
MTDGKWGVPQRPGGKLLADALVAQGVTHAFCVPGESYLDLLDGSTRSATASSSSPAASRPAPSTWRRPTAS